jgi:hypothetical protein
VPWFDRSLVGAAGGITPSVLSPKLCSTCDTNRDWVATEARTAALRDPHASGEAQLIASHLESLTVPLIAISNDGVVPVEIRQIESRPTRTSLR